jgi:hypothetical protein
MSKKAPKQRYRKKASESAQKQFKTKQEGVMFGSGFNASHGLEGVLMAKTVKKHESIYIHIRKSVIKWLALWLAVLYTYVSVIVYIAKTNAGPDVVGWFWIFGVGFFIVIGALAMFGFLIWVLVNLESNNDT